MAFAGRISVFGGRVITEEIASLAEELGHRLAGKNYLVYCGGGLGVMEAVSKGVAEAGGTVVGILKGENTEEANPYISIPVATNMGVTRNALLAYTCDAAVAVSGNHGTLSEIAFALQLNKPVIGLKTWDIEGVIPAKTVDDVIRLLDENLKDG